MSKGNWTRITHDDRAQGETRNNFTYHCANEHSWVVPFDTLEQLVDQDLPNDCPECALNAD
jgi:hypothetical protein